MKFAKWLYRHFGIILPILREQWDRDTKNIQFQLDNVRFEVNRYNSLHHTDYTSKKVLDIICK